MRDETGGCKMTAEIHRCNARIDLVNADGYCIPFTTHGYDYCAQICPACGCVGAKFTPSKARQTPDGLEAKATCAECNWDQAKFTMFSPMFAAEPIAAVDVGWGNSISDKPWTTDPGAADVGIDDIPF